MKGRFSPPLRGGFFSRCCELAPVRNRSTQWRKHLTGWGQTCKEWLLPTAQRNSGGGTSTCLMKLQNPSSSLVSVYISPHFVVFWSKFKECNSEHQYLSHKRRKNNRWFFFLRQTQCGTTSGRPAKSTRAGLFKWGGSAFFNTKN